MNVLFVYNDIEDMKNYHGYIYLGIGYLASFLKKEGINVELLHVTKPLSKEEFIGRLPRKRVDLVAFTATTNRFPLITEWANWTKESRETITICGGPHPTLQSKDSLNSCGLDMICIGEGERALLELSKRIANGDDVSGVNNIWTKKNGLMQTTPIGPLIEDLDSLPIPDRELFDFEQRSEGREKTCRIIAIRGCPYNCTYCCNHSIRNIYPNKNNYVRYRSVANVIEELKILRNRYPFIESFNFIDDILPLNKKWFLEFVQQYKREISIPYICHCFPLLIDRETVKLLKESNCIQVQIGIESGNEYNRKIVLNRKVSNERLVNAFHLCREFGIRTYAYNMLGIPYETKEQMLETLKLNALCGIEVSQTSIFYPYQGTELYNISRDSNLITARNLETYFSDTQLNFKEDERIFINFMCKYFKYLLMIYIRINNLPSFAARFFTILLDGIILYKHTSGIALKLMPFLQKMKELSK